MVIAVNLCTNGGHLYCNAVIGGFVWKSNKSWGKIILNNKDSRAPFLTAAHNLAWLFIHQRESVRDAGKYSSSEGILDIRYERKSADGKWEEQGGLRKTEEKWREKQACYKLVSLFVTSDQEKIRTFK